MARLAPDANALAALDGFLLTVDGAPEGHGGGRWPSSWWVPDPTCIPASDNHPQSPVVDVKVKVRMKTGRYKPPKDL